MLLCGFVKVVVCISHPLPNKTNLKISFVLGNMADIFRTNGILHKSLKRKIEFKIVEWAEGVGVR